MATVDAEKKLQNRVLHWLVDDLGYTYLGNLEDIDNTPVKEELLEANPIRFIKSIVACIPSSVTADRE